MCTVIHDLAYVKEMLASDEPANALPRIDGLSVGCRPAISHTNAKPRALFFFFSSSSVNS